MNQHLALDECHVEFTASFERVRLLAGQHAGLQPDSVAEVFETLAWFENLARHGFADATEPLLLYVADQRRHVAMVVPLAIPPQRAAVKLRSLSNYYSSLYGAVGDVQDDQLWRAIAAALRGHPQGVVLDFGPMQADGRFMRKAAQALREAGYWVDRYHCFGNWFLPLRQQQTFATYFAELPSALRNSISRGRRRIARESNAQLAIHDGAPGPALEQAIADFVSVYNASWKQAEPCPAFIPGLIRTAAGQGWLRLGILRLGVRPIAAQLWLVNGGKANIYKLAYVQGLERLSPGSVLTAAMMEHVMDVDHVREVDYLTGDDAYKQDWMRERRERVGLLACNPRHWRGLLEALRQSGGRWARRLFGR